MARQISLLALAALALGAVACTPAAEPEKEPETTTTIVEREVQTPPVVIERETPPPVVIETDRDRGDTTTVRAGENGLEVETTNR